MQKLALVLKIIHFWLNLKCLKYLENVRKWPILDFFWIEKQSLLKREKKIKIRYRKVK